MLNERARLMSVLLALGAMASVGCNAPGTPTQALSARSLNDWQANWKPVVLGSVSELTVPAAARPGSQALRDELAELRALKAGRDATVREEIKALQAVPLVFAWNDYLRDRTRQRRELYFTPRLARTYALVNVAMHDACLAAMAIKRQVRRPAPGALDLSVEPLIWDQPVSSFPSEHAAMVYAAAIVMESIAPVEAGECLKRAQTESEARLKAGANFPSDIAAGRAIGEQVAARVLAHAGKDGSDASGEAPQHDPRGTWSHAFGAQEPRAGTWRPWWLKSGDQFRLPEPAWPGTPAFKVELDEVLETHKKLDDDQKVLAWKWANNNPFADWNRLAIKWAKAARFDDVRGTRLMTVLSIIQADAGIACWNNKFHYNLARPEQMAPLEATGFEPFLIRAPNHPSYPSGHSTFSAASGEFLKRVFPAQSALITTYQKEASISRLYGGIHYRQDLVGGNQLGQQVFDYIWGIPGVQDGF